MVLRPRSTACALLIAALTSPTQAEEALRDPAERGLDLDHRLSLGGDWALGGSLETYPATEGIQVRGRVLRDIGNGLSIGPEISVEQYGDERIRQWGLTLEGVEPLPGVETRFRAGMRSDEDGESGAFFGIEFEHRF